MDIRTRKEIEKKVKKKIEQLDLKNGSKTFLKGSNERFKSFKSSNGIKLPKKTKTSLNALKSDFKMTDVLDYFKKIDLKKIYELFKNGKKWLILPFLTACVFVITQKIADTNIEIENVPRVEALTLDSEPFLKTILIEEQRNDKLYRTIKADEELEKRAEKRKNELIEKTAEKENKREFSTQFQNEIRKENRKKELEDYLAQPNTDKDLMKRRLENKRKMLESSSVGGV